MKRLSNTSHTAQISQGLLCTLKAFLARTGSECTTFGDDRSAILFASEAWRTSKDAGDIPLNLLLNTKFSQDPSWHSKSHFPHCASFGCFSWKFFEKTFTKFRRRSFGRLSCQRDFAHLKRCGRHSSKSFIQHKILSESFMAFKI